jgi:regulator of protease activity HflC (stomatin/prohibitin superfamily)
MGRFSRILNPGLNFLIPVIDQIKYVQSLKEIAIGKICTIYKNVRKFHHISISEVPQQSAITSDNVTLNIDGVLYLKILNAYDASYGVEDPEFAITQLAQTTMRSELGKMSLDKIFQERECLNVSIVDAINKASESWGIQCLRYEIRDIKLPNRIHEAMQMQVEAERRKRAAILESEGIRAADINVAEGRRQSRILASEAEQQESINIAEGKAKALLTLAKARAEGLKFVAEQLKNQTGNKAASLLVAEDYIKAFGNLAKTGNTLILSSNASDVSSIVSQAMATYNTINNRQSTIDESIDESIESLASKLDESHNSGKDTNVDSNIRSESGVANENQIVNNIFNQEQK